MVKKQFKYHWKNRKQVFELKNKECKIIAEIENVGLIGMRARRMAEGLLVMSGITESMHWSNEELALIKSKHPLSGIGESAAAPNSDAL